MKRNPPAHERIRRRTSVMVARTAAKGPDAVLRRLRALDRELDVQRASELLIAAAAFLGAGLYRPERAGWLALTGAAASLLLQHAMTGWSPAAGLLRQLGLRTAREIEEEREALTDSA
ncbi:MAG: DUF2892 domain-containing protein [Elusimicrobia bacterium]|nr:DUF2892 domain-containing protein [Elusimicrobiota bacterium]